MIYTCRLHFPVHWIVFLNLAPEVSRYNSPEFLFLRTGEKLTEETRSINLDAIFDKIKQLFKLTSQN